MDRETRRLIFKLLLANNILIIISLIFILFFVFNKNYIYVANPKRIKKLDNAKSWFIPQKKIKKYYRRLNTLLFQFSNIIFEYDSN